MTQDTEADYASLPVIDLLPDAFGTLANKFPPEIIGATILALGTVEPRCFEGGGLVIDYLPRGAELARRTIFEFNDRAMEVSFDGLRAIASQDAAQG